MHPKLDEYLCKKYPKIFRDRHAPMTQTCMCWGFEHGNGWFHLINTLCGSIQNHIDNHNKWVEEYGKEFWEENKDKPDVSINEPVLIPQVVAAQVKEKFGGLRFYYDGGDDIIRGMVYLAENMSYRICENCGVMTERVNTNQKGWISTTCPMCVRDGTGDDHYANQDEELVRLWDEVREEEQDEVVRKLKERMDKDNGE